jgi:hypothetical protein
MTEHHCLSLPASPQFLGSFGWIPKTEVPAERLRTRKNKAFAVCHLQPVLRALRVSAWESSVSETSEFGLKF